MFFENGFSGRFEFFEEDATEFRVDDGSTGSWSWSSQGLSFVGGGGQGGRK